MKLYEITIKPQSPLGTPLKGDTIFGHFCWQAVNRPQTLNGGFDHWIASYPERPFAVFSSAWPRLVEGTGTWHALKRPDLPLSMLFPASGDDGLTRLTERKKNKKKKWLLVDETLHLTLAADRLLDESGLYERYRAILSPETATRLNRQARQFLVSDRRSHNSINRLTMTTGEGFAPYVQENICYLPESELTIFCLLEPEATDIDRVLKAFAAIGSFGFGRDASSGLGRFEVGEWEEIVLPATDGANACYTLGPSVPESGCYRQSFFTHFTRFGRHGDRLVLSGNPFKAPVVMADEGAIFVPHAPDAFDKPYLGRAVTGISLAEPRTVAQGYSIYLPCHLEVS